MARIFLSTFFRPQPVRGLTAGGAGRTGRCSRVVPRRLHMSTRLCPPTCPQVVQRDVHTGVGRAPLRLPSVLPELPPGTNCRCPAVAIPRTHVRVGDPRLLCWNFPPASAEDASHEGIVGSPWR